MIAALVVIAAVCAGLCLCCFLADRPRPQRPRVPQPTHVRLVHNQQEPRQ